ncbi:hypothetical protein [Roseomonas fluvialis]|uniref:Lipoprotein n=1 Tax=Roseomonas fluvialis TaxID=1750527 RepID=A0ABM7Y4R0_9PROT|nr:hypothetical protein [Roseomonas fluvialis]BDG72847.1 hypothetical protein Rmf_27760 [Roseomonas fluvialis]
MLPLLAACALPPNTALQDWARTASVAVDQPALLAGPAQDGLLAQQQALAAWLYALGVLAGEEQPLTFRAARFAPLAARAAADPTAAEAVAALGAVLERAQAGNIPPAARAYSAGQAQVVEDLRLRPAIRAANGPVQVLAASLGAAMAAGEAPAQDRTTYRRVLDRVAEGHAMIDARTRHITQVAVAREIRDAEDTLLRLQRLLPPDPVVAARPPGGGAVAALVQP